MPLSLRRLQFTPQQDNLILLSPLRPLARQRAVKCRFPLSSQYVLRFLEFLANNSRLSTQLNVTFPRNAVQIYAELYASGNRDEEFWVLRFAIQRRALADFHGFNSILIPRTNFFPNYH